MADNDTAFAGPHGIGKGRIDVFFATKGKYFPGEGWYWWEIISNNEVGPLHGPFPTAEGAYLDGSGE